jgi:hypothetical protein
MTIRAPLLALLSALAFACDDGADATETTGTTAPVDDERPPTASVEALEAWLAAASYRAWPAESGVHPSAGPHAGNVRTWVNQVALDSLAAGAAEHPEGAATVKELYGDGTAQILGYAVSLKTAPTSDGGEAWYWYERVGETVYGGELGTGLCTGCHGGGDDFILTPYPLP